MFDLERPFHRLVHHFIYRMFYGAGEGDELQFGIPAFLGILSTPAAFGAIALLSKYSTLRLYLSGRPDFDVYRASAPDEYFFVVYSMVVTGAIVVLKWDRLFPDRQDYDNLAALPLSAGQILKANLIALLFLAGLFALDINAAACVIFPFAVTQKYDTFAAYAEFAVAHAAAVVLASFFVCFALLSLLGFTMLITPRRYLRRASLAVRIAAALALVAILGSAFSLPPLLLLRQPPEFLAYVPPVWFLDLHQGLLDLGVPLTGTAMFSLVVTAAAFFVAIGLYALTYYRHFARIAEQSEVNPASGRDKHSILRQAIDAFVLRTPFQRATYHFVMKTLFRSEKHCLLFGLAAGTGFFLAGQAVSDAVTNPGRFAMDPRILSVPLILSYFIIISLRALFDLPTDRSSNWIFRSIIDKHKHEARPLAAKVIISLIVPWLVLIAMPLYARAWGWTAALLHTAYVLMCSAALTDILLFRFRKIPFTCMHTAGKDRILVMVIFVMLGFSFFGPINAWFEISLLRAPFRFLFVLPVVFALLWGVRELEKEAPASDRALIFEDRPPALLQVLDLSKNG